MWFRLMSCAGLAEHFRGNRRSVCDGLMPSSNRFAEWGQRPVEPARRAAVPGLLAPAFLAAE
jgi:hypothetical protein